MTYYPAVYSVGWRRVDGRPIILYSGSDRLEGLEALHRWIQSGVIIAGRVVRRDGSPLFVVEGNAREQIRR